MMYLPWPKTFRNHPLWGESFLATMADKMYQADFYPYRDMTVNEADELINRTITDFPIAEKYLEVANRSPRNPWQYKDSLTVLKYDVVSLLKKLKLYSFYRVLKLWITI